MGKFRIKFQFYSPDMIPTSTGEFTQLAKDKSDAVFIKARELSEQGYEFFNLMYVEEI